MSQDRLLSLAKNLSDAVERLNEALDQPYSVFVRDSVIKRFEICWELAWEFGQKWLLAQGIEALTPRASWEGLLSAGILMDGNRWSRLQRVRNLTAHIYDEKFAQQIYEELRADALKEFQDLAVWVRENVLRGSEKR